MPNGWTRLGITKLATSLSPSPSDSLCGASSLPPMVVPLTFAGLIALLTSCARWLSALPARPGTDVLAHATVITIGGPQMMNVS